MDKKITTPSLFNHLKPDIKAKEEAKHYLQLPKNHISWAIKIGFWFIFILAITLIMVKAFHLITPISYAFLSTHQLQQIDSILFSSAVSSVMTILGKKLTDSNP